MRHKPFAAGLVYRAATTVDDHGVQSGAGREGCGGESGRAGPGDDEIDHDSFSKAVFSVRIRTVSKAALSAVNTTAVIQAECTSGNAIPSATTAT